MSRFTVENIKDLKAFLSSSNIHDGVFTQAYFDYPAKTFTAYIENTVWNDSFTMIFSQVQEIVAISDFSWGTDETIICLAEISDEEELPKEISCQNIQDNLCFVWEMLSGNRIYIVCKELEAKQ